tara:strand:- start:15483 stop:16067 length:585 start_codon:yes stop_codon:yes gene_type:complete
MKEKIDYFILEIVLPYFLNIYDRSILYRIRRAWGAAHLRKVKNKGNNVRIVGYSRIINPDKLILGNNVRIGYNCFFFCSGGIKIGDNSIISRNVSIYSSNHDFTKEMIPYNCDYIHREVVIGRGVWIGMNVNITPGVSIGDGAIIGMNVTVSSNVQPGEVIVSQKNRVVKSRDMDSFYKNMEVGNIFSVKYPDK